MNVFIQNIDPNSNEHELKRALADILHGPKFSSLQALPINFAVTIHRQTRPGVLRTGILTVPSVEIGCLFLQECRRVSLKWSRPQYSRLRFIEGKYDPHPEIVNTIARLPYVDPKAQEEHDIIVGMLRCKRVQVQQVQFGWECRNGDFSIEWEKDCTGVVTFDLDKREYHITYENHTISIRSSQIAWTATALEEDASVPCVYFSLQHPPSFESRSTEGQNGPRHRWEALDDGHAPFAPYTSLALRLLCRGVDAVKDLRWIAQLAHVRTRDNNLPSAVRLNLFSLPVQAEYDEFLSGLKWEIAFQVDSLVRNHLMDLKEVLSLRRHIIWMMNRRTVAYTAAFLRHLATQAREPFWLKMHPDDDWVRELWLRCRKDFEPRDLAAEGAVLRRSDTFMCLHVIVTPTRIIVDGPLPEQSNRIMRQYADHTANFLRVRFVDENGFIYHLDRDVRDREFIHRRFGGILLQGLDIAGRHFEFLAYSQSGLKQHAVWFMTPFTAKVNELEVEVTPDYILSSIGLFDGIEYDPELVYCPARYGARISQAFTATEAAVELEVEEIIILPDIYDVSGRRSFTDGVGTMSPAFAKHIWKALQMVSRRHAQNLRIEYAPAAQIRCQGSKGMLSVDYKLSGRQLCLRRSMIKFEAPESKYVEIVTAFTSPGKFYLNRPLIMMLEDLKIKGGYDILHELQDAVVTHTKDAKKQLDHAGSLMERFGLGSSFKLASIFLNLHKLGGSILGSPFHTTLIDFAIHHVLRELKYHARIPVPDGYTLPGVADIHKWLSEGEIFVCIAPGDGSEPFFLEGPVMIFRSPTIHPGDIQVAEAIGKPPPGSPFEHEPLANTVVFSTQGTRPLASCLAGGDLDGDVFVCSTLKALMPRKISTPADYLPSSRKTVTHPSTRQDMADFVTEFLYSDSVGIIATAWLLRADQSDLGINDPACLQLAQLHSDAVDYAKTGQPVPVNTIPRMRSYVKPDWSCPELSSSDNTKLYYESQRWLGKLFREIKLPEPRIPRSSHTSMNRSISFDTLMTHFHDNKLFSSQQDQTIRLVRKRVSEFIEVYKYSKAHIRDMWTVFHEFASTLRTLCASHTISSSRSAMLTEEEAIVGTIVAKSSAPKRRKDLISQLREQTALLLDQTATQIIGKSPPSGVAVVAHTELALKRAWVAYCMSIILRNSQCFGSRAFGLLALFEIFDAIKTLEAEAEASSHRSTTSVVV